MRSRLDAGTHVGAFINKPWTVATNCRKLIELLAPCVCPQNHSHVPCAGADAETSGNCTARFAEIVHTAFKRHHVEAKTLGILSVSAIAISQDRSVAHGDAVSCPRLGKPVGVRGGG